MRQAVLIVALAFIALLAFLTLDVIAREGLNVLEAISLLVLALFAFGVLGALRHPPEE